MKLYYDDIMLYLLITKKYNELENLKKKSLIFNFNSIHLLYSLNVFRLFDIFNDIKFRKSK